MKITYEAKCVVCNPARWKVLRKSGRKRRSDCTHTPESVLAEIKKYTDDGVHALGQDRCGVRWYAGTFFARWTHACQHAGLKAGEQFNSIMSKPKLVAFMRKISDRRSRIMDSSKLPENVRHRIERAFDSLKDGAHFCGLILPSEAKALTHERIKKEIMKLSPDGVHAPVIRSGEPRLATLACAMRDMIGSTSREYYKSIGLVPHPGSRCTATRVVFRKRRRTFEKTGNSIFGMNHNCSPNNGILLACSIRNGSGQKYEPEKGLYITDKALVHCYCCEREDYPENGVPKEARFYCNYCRTGKCRCKAERVEMERMEENLRLQRIQEAWNKEEKLRELERLNRLTTNMISRIKNIFGLRS